MLSTSLPPLPISMAADLKTFKFGLVSQRAGGYPVVMPRPPRIDFPDAVYHVTSRGNGRSVIFWSDADRERFLSQLADNLRLASVALRRREEGGKGTGPVLVRQITYQTTQTFKTGPVPLSSRSTFSGEERGKKGVRGRKGEERGQNYFS